MPKNCAKRPGKKLGDPNKLTDNQIANAFLLYSAHKSIKKVHEITGHYRATLQRYRDEGNWIEKIKVIKANIIGKVANKIEQEAVKETLSNYGMVRALIESGYLLLKAKLDDKTAEVTINDMKILMYLESFLTGGPDGRLGSDGTLPGDNSELMEKLVNTMAEVEKKLANDRDNPKNRITQHLN